MRILLVEDDLMLGESLERALASSDHTTDWVRDGTSADALLKMKPLPFDLLLLDIGLPFIDGLAVLRALRQRGTTIPVIILTAKGDITQRIIGLDAGADDYLPKPFALDELDARIRALQRRTYGNTNPVIKYGSLQLNPVIKEVQYFDKPVMLSSREYQILEALLRRPGAIVSRTQLEEQLYDLNTEIDSNAVEVYVHRLRNKLSPELIRTVRGLGYQLVND